MKFDNLLRNQLNTDSNSENSAYQDQPPISRSQQLLWFVALWIVGVLAMGTIAAVFKFFVQFAYD